MRSDDSKIVKEVSLQAPEGNLTSSFVLGGSEDLEGQKEFGFTSVATRVSQFKDSAERLFSEVNNQSPAKRSERSDLALATKELENWNIECVEYQDEYKFNAIKFISLVDNKFSFAVPDGLFGKSLDPSSLDPSKHFDIPLTKKVTLFDKIINDYRSKTANTNTRLKVETPQTVDGSTKYIDSKEPEIITGLYNIIIDVKNLIGSLVINRVFFHELNLENVKELLTFLDKKNKGELNNQPPNFDEQTLQKIKLFIVGNEKQQIADIGSMISKLGIYGLKEDNSINYKERFSVEKLPFDHINATISRFYNVTEEQQNLQKLMHNNSVVSKIAEARLYEDMMKQSTKPSPSLNNAGAKTLRGGAARGTG